jgi:hypothetical protein
MRKRFLIPLLSALALPTAVNAFPFGGDIVYKTDVGEKYIVKKSTVEKISENIWISYLRISDEISYLEQLIKERKEVWYKPIKENLEIIEDDKKRMVEKGRPIPTDLYQAILEDNKFYENKFKIETDPLKEELKTNKKLLQELEVYIQDNKKNLVMLAYTPIYVDLNGTKTIQDEKIVACVKPNLNSQKRTEISKKSEEFLVESDDKSLKGKICKQHAKF